MVGFTVPEDKYSVITAPLVTNSGAVDVFVAEDRYAVFATGSGIDVVDLYKGLVVSYGTIAGVETTCVAVDYNTTFGNMYVGTTNSGVYAAPWKPLRGTGVDFSSQLVQQFSTATSPPISHDQINDLYTRPFRLLMSTASGVDFIVDQGHTLLRSTHPLISGSDSCYLTADMEGYWVATNSGVETNYDLNSTSGTGIINIDYLYNYETSPAMTTNQVNDLSVVAGTNNLLGFATISGGIVIEEVQGAEASASAKFEDAEVPVVSMDFSQSASFNDGFLYMGVADSLQVFSLTTNTVTGTHYHTILEADKYDKENTRDQALVTGTTTIVRTTSVA